MNFTHEQIYSKTVARVMAALEQQTSASVESSPENQDLISLISPISHPSEEWPKPIASEGFHGLAGEFVRLVEPHSEADPSALLTQFLVAAGSVIGRGPHFVAEADEHHLSLYITLVGRTAKGRKGSSLGHVRRVFRTIDPTWDDERVLGGLASGEGLIWSVRDAVTGPVKDKKTGRMVEESIDPGVDDKRVLVIEPEFARTLQVCSRDGATLSPVIRQAFDGGSLRILTKNKTATATDAHISIIGHITKDELLRTLDRTETANGFCNRFLWVCTSRSKLLPDGGRIQEVDFKPFMDRLRKAIKFARGIGEICRDEQAGEIWREAYPRLSEGYPGLLGAVTSRAEVLVMRLACLYAVLDLSRVVRAEQLAAALAVWQYCHDSARFIFGGSLGDPTADTIMHALRQTEQGMTRTEISGLFHGHKKKGDVARALNILQEYGLAESSRVETDGRAAELWFARSLLPAKEAKKAKEGSG